MRKLIENTSCRAGKKAQSYFLIRKDEESLKKQSSRRSLRP